LSLYTELKRRNVFKVAAAYFIIAWLLLQVSDTLGPALHLPEWFLSAVAFLLILGFPIVIFFAWAFELTPEGVRKEKQQENPDSPSHTTGPKINYLIIVLIGITLVYQVWGKFTDRQDVAAEPNPTTPVVKSISTESAIPEQKPDKKSIAVLPFQNRSINEENSEFFANGVHDELLTNLSRISELKVISRTSVRTYRNTTKNLRQIGEELGVAHLLEGGVQRSGDTVRINVQLIDAINDEHLWAEVYERKLSPESIFAIQAEISQAIAKALQATLSPVEQKLLAAIPTTNLEAYDYFLIADQLMSRNTWQSLSDAQSYLKKATALDPNFVQAYVLLANTYYSLFGTGAVTLQEIIKPWEQAIQTAMLLDIDSAGTYAAQARFLWRTGKEGAEAAFKKARELEPANADIMVMYAGYLLRNSQISEAMKLYLTAKEYNPLSIPLLWGLAASHEAMEDFDKALSQFAKIRQIDPSSSAGIGPAAGIYLAIGEIAQSQYWVYKAMVADPDDVELPNWIVRAYMDYGDYSSAGRWLDWIEQNYESAPMTLSSRAMLDVYNGNLGLAAAVAQRALLEKLPNRWGSNQIMVRVLLKQAIAQKQSAEMLKILTVADPGLFETTPQIRAANVILAIDTAHLLMLENRLEEARNLLQTVISFYEIPYAGRTPWLVSGKAQALALLGEKQAAITELRRQVDKGMRLFWLWNTELNPNFNQLRSDPEFQAIVDFLRKEVAMQFQQLQSMEAAGEIPSPPKSSV